MKSPRPLVAPRLEAVKFLGLQSRRNLSSISHRPHYTRAHILNTKVATAVPPNLQEANALYAIPTVGGSSLPFLSYIVAHKNMRNNKELLQEGYRKYYGTTFKFATLSDWIVVVSGPDMINDLGRRSDEELSFIESTSQALQFRVTVGPEPFVNQYHIGVIKDKLTRNLPVIMPGVIEELSLAVTEHIPANDQEWLEIETMETMKQIIARISSRVFVGLPLCRNEDYLDLAISFASAIASDSRMLTWFPAYLKPAAARLFSNVARNLSNAVPHLLPVIASRRSDSMKERGEEWSDKQDDMLQWIMEIAQARNESDLVIAKRIMMLNFAAIHTSSTSASVVLHRLAEHPECIAPLREEIETVVQEEGWTKAAMGKMWKLDSLLREYQRHDGIGLITMPRKAMKDVTLLDGTLVPRGTTVVATSHGTHRDSTIYDDPEVFDPFRFSRMREAEGESTKHQFVNISTDYIPFGVGRHACPGRFFAANELKSLLAHLILNYDFKRADDGDDEPLSVNFWGPSFLPEEMKILFRKRKAEE
ncbi:cytochrome P450 [Trametes meyenii]|nr:cytochrome P450 [Trametes meyenii]